MSFSLLPLKEALHADPRLIPALRGIETKHRGEVYCVGGCIRDSLLNRPVTDIDLAVSSDAMGCARIFAEAVKGAFVPLDNAEDVGRVVFRRWMTFDFASFKGQTLDEDLSRRDFTINAIACRFSSVLEESSSLIDPLGGGADIENKKITAVSEQAFPDDPLRMLRAYRFAAQLDFLIERNTRVGITRWAHRLPDMSKERVQDEIAVLLTQNRAAPWIREMSRSGVLSAVLPELDQQHPFFTLEHVERILEAPASTQISGLGGLVPTQRKSNRDWTWVLRLAALLIDHRPPHHRSEEWITTIATVRLRLSNREQRMLLSFLQMPVRIKTMIAESNVTDDALYGISRHSGEDTGGVILLTLALCQADDIDVSTYLPSLDRLVGLDERRQAVQAGPRLVTGDDLITLFDLQPGPRLGVLLERLEMKQVTDDIRTREEALAAVESWLESVTLNGNEIAGK
ncbi:MAG: hypothetical protein VYA69_06165 [Gemmatimonadota bacterium]|nr:hypothetical protein [Gemmatimonadota bacterium]